MIEGSADGPLFDPESGLASESFIRFLVAERVRVARPRLAEVWVALVTARGADAAQLAAPRIALVEALGQGLDDADAVGRLVDGRVLALFDDVRERAVLEALANLRAVSTMRYPKSILHAGVAAYPRHGYDVDELIAAAGHALVEAQRWPIHRVEIAHTP